MADKPSKLRKGLSRKEEFLDLENLAREKIMDARTEDLDYTPYDRESFTSEYEEYKVDQDSLAAEERKEKRKIKRRNNMIKAIGKAVDALGKIGASKAGGLVTGDLIPDLDFGSGEEDEISDLYDTKQLDMTKKLRGLKTKERELALKEDQEEEIARKKRSEKVKEASKELEDIRTQKRKAAVREKEDNYVASKALKSSKQYERFLEDFSEGIKDETLQGEDVMEEFEDLGISEEITAPFKETLGFFEDEEKQVEILKSEKFKQDLIKELVKIKVQNEIDVGKTISPRIIESLGLTGAAKSNTIEESKTSQYKIFEKGNPVPIITPEITEEKADDIRKDPKVEKVVRAEK